MPAYALGGFVMAYGPGVIADKRSRAIPLPQPATAKNSKANAEFC